MKINLYVRYLTVCVIATTTSLFSNQPVNNQQQAVDVAQFAQTHTDTYLQSPAIIASSITLASLHEFFDTRNYEKLQTRTPSVEHNQAIFYSQAMILFVQKVYNASDYARHLSQDGSHMTEFLSIANEFNLSCEQLYTGLRLFFNKLKEVQIVDDTVLTHVLDALPDGLEAYFPLRAGSQSKPHRSPSKIVENILLSQLTDHLTTPQHSNEQFFHNISHQIASTLHSEPQVSDEQAMRERLRQLTVRFVEQLTAKTMWYADTPSKIWESVLNAGHRVNDLGFKRIINDRDDLDDIYKTLVSRFVYFLETYGSVLPLSFYEQVKYDVNNHSVRFLEQEELDEGVRSKKDYLLDALTKAEAKAIATHRHGATAS